MEDALTVSELITELLKLPPDYEVIMVDGYWDCTCWLESEYGVRQNELTKEVELVFSYPSR